MVRGADFHIQGPQIHQFNNIAPRKIPRSAFKRDFTRRTTFNSNDLVPIFLDEILPGDDVSLHVTAQVRMTTPLKPIMDNLYLETFFFFVPNRLVWSNWEFFQGQRTLIADDPTTKVIPVLDKTKAPMSTTGFGTNSVYDHFGLPTLVTGLTGVSCLFNRAYDLIYDEWFRDESLQDSIYNGVAGRTGDGPDDPGTYSMRKRNKRKDYFTSCLPWPQKGTAVTLPLGTVAPVISTGAGNYPSFSDGTFTSTMTTAAGNSNVAWTSGAPGSTGQVHWVTTALQADLTNATASTINAIRQAALYQQILELDARGGTRYVEAIYSRFGVVSPDFRLQRPELIGQGQSMVNVYAVPQTSGSGASGTTTPLGNLAAFSATPITSGHGCRYSATEHGMIIGIANVRADLTYQQGLPRMFTRSTRLDFYEPLLNGLGEQVVRNDELDATGTGTDPSPFGYNERFAEYRFKNSEICGVFRSNSSAPLDSWHLSQQLVTPALNSVFITEAVPMDRVLSVATSVAPNFLADIAYGYNHVRPMPIRSNPGIDRL